MGRQVLTIVLEGEQIKLHPPEGMPILQTIQILRMATSAALQRHIENLMAQESHIVKPNGLLPEQMKEQLKNLEKN